MDEHPVVVQGQGVVEVLRRLRVDRERELAAQVDAPFLRERRRIVGLEAGQLALLHQQRLEHRLDPVSPPEHALQPRPATAGADEREVAGPRLAAAALVEHDGHAGREVRLADEELSPPGQLDYELPTHAFLGRRW